MLKITFLNVTLQYPTFIDNAYREVATIKISIQSFLTRIIWDKCNIANLMIV